MSGHSKWNNIKNKKGKADAARGKIFTKLGREILMAVKSGGPDVNANSKLKDVVAKAKANNMPNDTIDKAIKRAAGVDNQESYEEIVYEGYGPNGVAIIVNATTDNRNRTASEVRHIFDKFGGNLGTNGCVSYLFDRKGVIILDKEEMKMSEDDLMLLAIEAGAENFEAGEDYFEIITSAEEFSMVREALEKANLVFAEASVQMVPQTYITLDQEASRKMGILLENLEDLDDVIEVFHNWEE
jgi:YebC/PmpR family DNA-binding regulatory protein